MNCTKTKQGHSYYKNAATNVKMVKKAAEKFIRNPDKYLTEEYREREGNDLRKGEKI